MQRSAAQRVTRRLLPSLAYRDYRYLWMTTLSSSGAAWGLIVARGWLVYDLSESSVWVGVTTFAAMIPLFLVPPFAGFLADKFQRRRLLGYVFVLQLAHNAVLATLAMTGVIEPWHLVVLAFFNGSARAAQMPISHSLLPNLVPKKLLLNAIALNSATMHGSRLLGAAVVAPLLIFEAAGPAFAVCSIFYMVAWFASSQIRSASTGVMERGRSAIHNFTAGVDYVFRHPFIRPFVILVFLHCSLTMSFESVLPALSDEQFNAEDGFSYLMMAVGGGALIGALGLSGLVSAHMRGRWLLVTGLLSAVSPLGLVFSTDLSTALVGAMLMGASQGAFMTLTASFFQAIVPDRIRGRAMSVYLLSIGGFMASFNLINGVMADVVGAQTMLAAGAFAFLAAMIVSITHLPLRRLFTQGEYTAVAPVAA